MNQATSGPTAAPALYVITRHPRIAALVEAVAGERGVACHYYDSVDAFSGGRVTARTWGLVLDVDGDGEAELALVAELVAADAPVGIVALGRNVSARAVVRFLRAGVLDFLESPIDSRALEDSVTEALADAARKQRDTAERLDFERRLDRLTGRQREIFDHLVLGKANKLIGYDLGISERTVEIHRCRLLRAMRVGSAVELARLAGAHGISTPTMLMNGVHADGGVSDR